MPPKLRKISNNSDNDTNISDNNTNSDITEIKNMIQLSNTNIEHLKESYSELVNQYNNLLKSVQYISDEYDKMKKTTENLQEKVKTNTNQINQLQDSLKHKDNTICELVCKVNELEQYSRVNNVEIVGLPESSTEDCKKIICDIASELQVDVQENDISTAHRLPNPNGKPPSIIAQFISREKKQAFIKNKTLLITNNNKFKNIKTVSKIFINEHLTPYNKSLLFKTKNLAREKHYKFAWFKNGKILLRKDTDSNVIRIRNEQDLLKFNNGLDIKKK